MTSFHDERLPTEVEVGARGGLGFMTTVLESNDGSEQRNINWSRARGRWDISYGIRDKPTLIEVRDSHLARYGKAYGFRFKDWMDYVMPRQTIGVGDGTTSNFAVFKEYESGLYTYRHYLTRIVDLSYTLWVNGVVQGLSGEYGLDINVGTVIFNPGSVPTAGQIIEFACQFDRPVRFDLDRLDIQAILIEDKEEDDQTEQDEGLEGLTAIPIVELKERTGV